MKLYNPVTKQKFQPNTGFKPNIVGVCSRVAIIIALEVAGIWATILPKSVMSSFPISEIKMLDIIDATFQSDDGIVWLRERSSQVYKGFIDTFKDDQL